MSAQLTLRVEGMTCGNCRSRVERSLRDLDGIAEADVNLATERARVAYAPDILDADAISAAWLSPQISSWTSGRCMP